MMAWYNEVRHTPWNVDGKSLLDDNGDELAVFADDTNKVERALLAAAPELLAALKEVVTPGAHTPETWDAAYARARAAINKAEGR